MKKIKKISLLCLIFSILFSIKFMSYGIQLDVIGTEYTEEYKKWLELSDEEKEKYIEPRVFVSPMNSQKYELIQDPDNASEFNVKSVKDVPNTLTQYTTYYGNVKDQGSTSACWAFSSATAFSANYYLRNKIVKEFSNFHMDFMTSSNYNPYGKGLSRVLDEGGNFETAMAYAMNGMGIALNDDMNKYNLDSSSYVYQNAINSTAKKNEIIEDLKNVETNYYVSSYIEVIGVDQIKKFIYNYGPLSTYTHAGSYSYFSSSNVSGTKDLAYYCPSSISADHAVTLVGWDDTYTNTRFSGKTGAFIALNSWGENFGNNGLYYIFYDDYFIKSSYGTLGATEVKEKDFENLYQYDECGYVGALKLSNTQPVYEANVFRRQSNGKEFLEKINVYFPTTDEVIIYIFDDEINDDISNAVMQFNYIVESPGYYQITLDTPIKLKNNRFAVAVKYPVYFPVEYPISTSNYCGTATSSIGESYISLDGKSFSDMYDCFSSSGFNQVNGCIKSYTRNVTTYTISFDSDGGSTVEDLVLDEDEIPTKPSDPVKEGYAFLGWYLDDVIYKFDTPLSSDTILKAKWEEINIIEVPESVNGDQIKIIDNNIFARMNGNNDGIITVEDFVNSLNLNVNWNKIIIEKYGCDAITYFKDLQENDENANMENATKVKICTQNNEYEFNFYQSGNVYLDANTTDGAIDINDVIKLRRAVLNDKSVLDDPNFVAENTDVNFSNSQSGEMGDIGDIISIRMKILSKKWQFSK